MSDTALEAAFKEAMADQPEGVVEEAADEVVENVEEPETNEVEETEDDIEVPEKEEEIPQDNRERSHLGRKISAFHKRQDKLEEAVSLIAKAFERISPPEPDPDEDSYVTKKDLKELQQKPIQEAEQYENDFINTFHTLCDTHNLEDSDREGIEKTLLEKYNQRVLNDGKLDGALNFERARQDWIQSKTKKVPVKGGTAPAASTKQKVTKKEPSIPRLDAATQSLYNFIARTDGEEAAKKRLKNL